MWLAVGTKILAFLGGVALHLYTVHVAYEASGFWGALFAFILPGIIEVYMVIWGLIRYEWFDPYTMLVIKYLAFCIVLFLLRFVFVYAADALSDDDI